MSAVHCSVVRTPTWHCTECGRALADAATARRKRGLPQRSANSATCSGRCERAREERFRREAAARGVQLKRGEWRCDECGCTAAEAIAKDEWPMTVRARVCSPRCDRQRTSRTVAAMSPDGELRAQPEGSPNRCRADRARARRARPDRLRVRADDGGGETTRAAERDSARASGARPRSDRGRVARAKAVERPDTARDATCGGQGPNFGTWSQRDDERSDESGRADMVTRVRVRRWAVEGDHRRDAQNEPSKPAPVA